MKKRTFFLVETNDGSLESDTKEGALDWLGDIDEVNENGGYRLSKMTKQILAETGDWETS